jgi:hypothetical protein
MNGVFLVILMSVTGGEQATVSLKYKTDAACRSAATKILAAEGVESVGCKLVGEVKAPSKRKA